jgi:hypothetical protein
MPARCCIVLAEGKLARLAALGGGRFHAEIFGWIVLVPARWIGEIVAHVIDHDVLNQVHILRMQGL